MVWTPMTLVRNARARRELASRPPAPAPAPAEPAAAPAAPTHTAPTGDTEPPRPFREPTTAELRAWARANGFTVSDRGRIPKEIVDVYNRGQRNNS